MHTECPVSLSMVGETSKGIQMGFIEFDTVIILQLITYQLFGLLSLNSKLIYYKPTVISLQDNQVVLQLTSL